MNYELESVREIWLEAFFSGQYDVLRQYEHDNFKVIFEEEERVEGSYTRYDRIAHAVNNGVWKPKPLNIEFEEYEYNRDLTECYVLLGLEEDQQQIQELWSNQEGWKIVELRFLKAKRTVY